MRDTDLEGWAKLKNMPDYFITWILIFAAISICGALISMSLGMQSQPTPLFLAEHKKLYEDWTTKPFVDITLVEKSKGCPIDYEPLFSREWPGTERVCKSYAKDLPVFVAIDEDDQCEGEVIESIPPINMTAIGDHIPCGKRGGQNFVNTMRVEEDTLKCFEPYVPCSHLTTPEETVCVEELKKEIECPILDIYMVNEIEIDQILS